MLLRSCRACPLTSQPPPPRRPKAKGKGAGMLNGDFIFCAMIFSIITGFLMLASRITEDRPFGTTMIFLAGMFFGWGVWMLFKALAI